MDTRCVELHVMAQMPPSAGKPRPDVRERDIIRGELIVEVDPDQTCFPVVEIGEAAVVRFDIKSGGHSEPADGSVETAHMELLCEVDGSLVHEYVVSRVGDDDVCALLAETDCLTDVNSFEDRRVEIGVTVRSRDTFQEFVTNLTDRAESVSVERLVRGVDTQMTAEVPLDDITPKQREAVELALEEGYYDSEKDATLGDLAEQFGISKSAMSQRLNEAQAKLVKCAFDGPNSWPSAKD